MSTTAQCPICGRFARASIVEGYDGTWNQIWVTTYCKKCGERVQTMV